MVKKSEYLECLKKKQPHGKQYHQHQKECGNKKEKEEDKQRKAMIKERSHEIANLLLAKQLAMQGYDDDQIEDILYKKEKEDLSLMKRDIFNQ